MTAMNGPIAGFAKTFSGGGRKQSAIAPSVTVAFVKVGTAVLLAGTELASSARKWPVNVDREADTEERVRDQAGIWGSGAVGLPLMICSVSDDSLP